MASKKIPCYFLTMLIIMSDNNKRDDNNSTTRATLSLPISSFLSCSLTQSNKTSGAHTHNETYVLRRKCIQAELTNALQIYRKREICPQDNQLFHGEDSAQMDSKNINIRCQRVVGEDDRIGTPPSPVVVSAHLIDRERTPTT